MIWRRIEASGQRCYDVVADGVRYRLFPHDDRIAKRALLKGPWNSRQELTFLRGTLASGGTMIDAGAHVGTTCLPFARMADVSVFAVEPHPVALERLRYNIAANEFSNVTVVPVALSDRDGAVRFGADMGNISESAVARETGDQIEVRSMRLASLLQEQEIKTVTTLKMDIERHEDRVLLPFFAEAERRLWPRHVLIEFIANRGSDPECVAVMKSLGFQEVLRTAQNVGLSRD